MVKSKIEFGRPSTVLEHRVGVLGVVEVPLQTDNMKMVPPQNTMAGQV